MIMRTVSFLVDELLWMLTWGWYQLSLGLIFSWLLFVCFGRMRAIPAAVLVIGSYAFAIFVYFAFVAGLFVHFFQWKFIAGETPKVFSPLDAALILGGIYSTLQFVFYSIISYWRPLPVARFFVLSLISNLAAAFFASFFIKILL